MITSLTRCLTPILLFVGLSSSLVAQAPDLLPGELWRADGVFYEGQNEIERDSFWSLVDSQPESRTLFRRGDRQEFGGTALIVGGAILTGGGLLVALTGSLLESEGDPTDNTAATLISVAGIGTLLGGIAMLSASNKNIERSIDKYNSIVVDQNRLGLYLGPNGMGLQIRIGR